MNPKVSIIISTYNMEKFIRHCLESALNQTLQDIEIIVVDNASTDATVSIVRSYQEKDSRISLIANALNLGTFDSRIIGLENARGEYIAFCDADDHYYENGIETLYKAALKVPEADIILSKNCMNDIRAGIYKTPVLLLSEIMPLWGCLYRKDLIERTLPALPRNMDIIVSEDWLLRSFIFYYATTLYQIKQDIYFYYINPVGSTNSSSKEDSIKKIKDVSKSCDLLYEFIKKNNIMANPKIFKQYQLVIETHLALGAFIMVLGSQKNDIFSIWAENASPQMKTALVKILYNQYEQCRSHYLGDFSNFQKSNRTITLRDVKHFIKTVLGKLNIHIHKKVR